MQVARAIARNQPNQCLSQRLVTEQNRLMAMLASASPIAECLSAICDSISQISPGTRATIFIEDRIQEWPNQWPDNGPSDGPDNDISAHHSISILAADKTLLGSLILSFDTVRSVSEEEQQLAEFGAYCISILLERDSLGRLCHRTNDTLRHAQEKYRSLFESMDEGFCICEMLFDDADQPYDYRFLEANSVLETLTGLSNVVGKTIREFVPDLEAEWFEIYGNVVRTGKPVRFEQQSTALNRWFDVNAFPIGEAQSNQLAIIFTNTTERKRAEQALQASEAQSRSILESITDAFFAVDRDWKFTYLNPQAERLLGRELGDLLGKVMWQEYPGIVGSEFETAYRQAVEDKVATSVVSYYPDHERWYEAHAYPAADGMTVYFRNVTDQKQAETALKKNVQQLRAIYDGTSRYMGLLTPDGTLVEINRAALDFVGTQAKDVIGLPLWATAWFRYTPAAAELIRQSVLRAAAGERDRQEISVTAPTGQVITFEFLVYPILNDAGEVVFIVPEATDITAGKQAKEALAMSEERFRNLADNIAQLAWIADREGKIAWYNQRWFDYTGMTMAEMTGWGWQQVHHPDHIDRVLAKVKRCLERCEPWEDTFPLRRKDGAYRWFLSRAIPIRSEQDNVLRWFGTNTDITEQREAEQARELLLAQEQTARLAAESANRIKDEFLAVVSHELRTPLNPILGWSQLLKKGHLPPQKTAQALDIIERNAKMQAQLISDLLDVSRILQGKLTLSIQPVDLSYVIRAAVETMQLSAIAKSIHLHIALDTAVGKVSGDVNRLQQVIWNLLSNAVKFTPQGGRIEVRLERVGAEAQVSVSDTGKGIHPDFLPYVFDHFRQEDASTTRKFGGLGLGLAIVHRLLELHGGTICVDSRGEGQGATFVFSLPLMPAPTYAQSLPKLKTAALLAAPVTAPPSLQNKRILVVDDNDSNRDYVIAALEAYGASVRAAASGHEAIALLIESPPDVLVSDVEMPDMNGYTLIQQIRALPAEQGGQTPAIALTAHAGERDYQQAMSAGFQRHIAKPVEPDVLSEIICFLLE